MANKKKDKSKEKVSSKKELQVTSPAQKVMEKESEQTVKSLEKLILSIKFYPVAVKADVKDNAVRELLSRYEAGNDTFKQLILYMIHENISQVSELKTMYNFEFYKRKFPNIEPAQNRFNVYKSMFHFNFSIEGICELVSILGRLSGDGAAKVLTYHFTFLSGFDSDAIRMIRNAVIEALGESNSFYAFNSLLTYARYCDNEQLINRIASSISRWSKKIDSLNIAESKKAELHRVLSELVLPNFRENHYR
ncbi:MAG: hypothetical protein ABII22_06485 [Candidatus Micrarchaeota archaeon]